MTVALEAAALALRDVLRQYNTMILGYYELNSLATPRIEVHETGAMVNQVRLSTLSTLSDVFWESVDPESVLGAVYGVMVAHQCVIDFDYHYADGQTPEKIWRLLELNLIKEIRGWGHTLSVPAIERYFEGDRP